LIRFTLACDEPRCRNSTPAGRTLTEARALAVELGWQRWTKPRADAFVEDFDFCPTHHRAERNVYG
jgi:hypothetical protein